MVLKISLWKKCQDSWFIHVSSFSVFYTEPWTGKRIVGERVGWSQHPWNMNISSSFSHHQQTNTHTHTYTRRVPSRTTGYRCFNFAASERGVGRVFSGLISPWHAMLHGHSSDLVTDGVKERSGRGRGVGVHHGRWWNLDTTESLRGLTKRSRTQARDLFSTFWGTSGHSWKKWHLLSSSRKSQHLRSKAFNFCCFLHHPVAF